MQKRNFFENGIDSKLEAGEDEILAYNVPMQELNTTLNAQFDDLLIHLSPNMSWKYYKISVIMDQSISKSDLLTFFEGYGLRTEQSTTPQHHLSCELSVVS